MARSLLIDVNMKSTRRPLRQGAEGFTLVELSVVVAIVGILSVVAMVGYRKYILHSKIAEARNVLSAIKIAQEDYRAEKGTYADLGATFCPTKAGVSDKKVGWDPECSGGGTLPDPKWHSLPVHIDGAVQFQYATVAGTGTFAAPAAANWVGWGGASTATVWFVAMAKCDLDGEANGDTQLVASSVSETIFSRNDGQ